MVIELRSRTGKRMIGLQTVVPPSTQPSGEHIHLLRYDDPTEVRSQDLLRAASHTAVAAILTRYWPDEGCERNEAFLALHGMLARDRRPSACKYTAQRPTRTRVDDFRQIECPCSDMNVLRMQHQMREWFEPQVMPELPRYSFVEQNSTKT